MEEKTVVTIYGKGEYALTDAKLDRLTKTVDDYNSNSNWKWMLQDVLGIHASGKIGKRFEEIKASLVNFGTDAALALHRAMDNVTPKMEVNRTHRTVSSSPEKLAERAEMLKLLASFGIAEEVAVKMAKAI